MPVLENTDGSHHATTVRLRAASTLVLQGPVTVDELLEMGRAKLMNHDLALEMSRLSEMTETLASEKEVQACGFVSLSPVAVFRPCLVDFYR